MKHSTASITIATPTLVYLIIEDRDVFEALAGEIQKGDNVDTKTIQQNDQMIVIQHWHDTKKKEGGA